PPPSARQSCSAPSLCIQRRPCEASPKFGVATICQSFPTLVSTKPPLNTGFLPPFQMATAPLSLRHKISARPSPFASSVSTICQLTLGRFSNELPRKPPASTVQKVVDPLVLCQ